MVIYHLKKENNGKHKYRQYVKKVDGTDPLPIGLNEPDLPIYQLNCLTAHCLYHFDSKVGKFLI